MSDTNDQALKELRSRLRTEVTGISWQLASLPLPILIPAPTDFNLIKVVYPAVVRAYDLIEEQPLPDTLLEHLSPALLHWLAAADLIKGFTIYQFRHQANAAVASLEACDEAQVELIEWQATQEG